MQFWMAIEQQGNVRLRSGRNNGDGPLQLSHSVFAINSTAGAALWVRNVDLAVPGRPEPLSPRTLSAMIKSRINGFTAPPATRNIGAFEQGQHAQNIA